MIRPRPGPPCWRCNRRALPLNSVGFSMPLSSMNTGASLSLPTAAVSFCQSSSLSAPVRMRCWSSLPTEPSMRITSCGPLISMLKMATGIFSTSATCSAILSAKAVLPMLGRPATTTRSAGCKPEVLRSRSVKPVAMPVTPLRLSLL